ncbi:hypothetical protein TRVL_02437 [Trypanosoma vivax]|nr:hypothetical protein TRVL_02437 [Trypanosoma vivax]
MVRYFGGSLPSYRVGLERTSEMYPTSETEKRQRAGFVRAYPRACTLSGSRREGMCGQRVTVGRAVSNERRNGKGRNALSAGEWEGERVDAQAFFVIAMPT